VPVDEEPEYEEIDPRLVAAGRAMNWTDERIQTIAETDESILADLANRLDKADGHRTDKEEEAPVKDDETVAELSDEAIKKLREKHGDEVVDTFILPALKNKAELASIKKSLSKVDDFEAGQKADAAARTQKHIVKVANEAFDHYSKQFKELGLTKDMKCYPNKRPVPGQPMVEVREKIFEVAHMFHEQGHDIHTAMDEAMTWYAGTQKDERLKRQLVKDVKGQKKRFTVKPNQRKVKRVYKTVRGKAEGIVGDAMKKAGIKK
jgi:hypothetical protein